MIEAARLRDTCGVPAAASIVGARLKAHQALRSVILRSTAAAKIPPVILTELETSSVTPSADETLVQKVSDWLEAKDELRKCRSLVSALAATSQICAFGGRLSSDDALAIQLDAALAIVPASKKRKEQEPLKVKKHADRQPYGRAGRGASPRLKRARGIR